MAPGHHESRGSGYSHDTWLALGGYTHSAQQHTTSPMPEYAGFDYNPAPMPMEPSYNIQRPPRYAASAAPLPPPLIMPQTVWPSMLTGQPSYQTPILPAAPIQTPVSATTSHGSDVTPTSARTPTARRKLTDDERRQMCLEAEQNPSMKQTQIGAKFNVERSTVSKILRQKEKYMNVAPREEIPSPGKKSKAKMPDFEKTLANWAKMQQKKGSCVGDDELRRQAVLFSFSRSDQALLSSPGWLEKFKQKHLVTHQEGVTLDTNEATVLDSSATSLSETPFDDTPSSSTGFISPLISAMDGMSHRSLKSEHDDFLNFGTRESPDDLTTLHQTLSSSRDVVKGLAISPGDAELARSDLHSFALAMEEAATGPGSNFNRQRSQTLPHSANGTHPRPSSSGRPSQALPVRAMTSTSEARPTSIDPRQTMKRHKSVPDIHGAEVVRYSSMQPPPLPRSAETSPMSPGLTHDENIKALHAIKTLLQQNPEVAEPDDYVMIGKLMEKLKLLRSPNGTPMLPGSLHAMDIHDSPRLSRKRTILGISS